MSKLKDAYRLTEPVRDPATKAELEMRLKNRPTPSPQQQLTPNNALSSQVNEKIANADEKRVTDLSERLQRMRENSDRDFTFARLEGRAKSDFDRSRE